MVPVHVHVHVYVPLLERCYSRGCYVQASVELGPEDVSLLEIPEGVMYRLRWSWGLTIREVSSFQRVLHVHVCTGFSGVGAEDVSLLERCPH